MTEEEINREAGEIAREWVACPSTLTKDIAALCVRVDREAREEQKEDDAKMMDYCTCGSGPEFRSLHMRHHAITCNIHQATMLRAAAIREDKP